MMQIKYKKILVADKSPEIDNQVIGIAETGEVSRVVLQESGYWYSIEHESECDEPEYWLEEAPNHEKELKEVLVKIVGFSSLGEKIPDWLTIESEELLTKLK